MARSVKHKHRIGAEKADDVVFPAPAGTASGQTGEEGRSLWKTAAIALSIPLIILAVLIIRTADSEPCTHHISAWKKLAGLPIAGAAGDTAMFSVGPEPVTMVYELDDAGRQFNRLDFDLLYQGDLQPVIDLSYGLANEGEYVEKGSVSLLQFLRRPDWNSMGISFDDFQGAHAAKVFRVTLSVPEGEGRAGLRDGRFSGCGPCQRLQEVVARLFGQGGLVASSINFVRSPKIAGFGCAFVLWLALPFVVLALLVRSFFFRERFSLATHLLACLIFYFILLDLRNIVELGRNAEASVRTFSASRDHYEHLARQERLYPWFASVAQCLREKTAAGSTFFIAINPFLDPFGTVADRLAYYARPARRLKSIEPADYAVLVQAPLEATDRGWEHRWYFEGADIYARVRR